MGRDGIGWVANGQLAISVEVKVLKSLVRNVVDPSRDLGHTDRALRAANVPVQSRDGDEKVVGKSQEQESTTSAATATKGEEKCEECQ